MKNFLTFFVMLIIFQVHAQDMQWYVKGKHFLTPVATSTSPTSYSPYSDNFMSCYIGEVKHPFRPQNVIDIARNDLFIIFENGNHFNSRYMDLVTEWKDWDLILSDPSTSGTTTASGVPIGSDYYLKTAVNIEYLYFTNVYEGDEEPDAILSPAPIPPSGNAPPALPFNAYGLNDIVRNTPPLPITWNHTPVPGKDITLILDHKEMDETCTYQLCINIESPELKDREKSSTLQPFAESPIFGSFPGTSFVAVGGGVSSNLTSTSDVLVENCINNLMFSTSAAYTYVNLRLAEDPDSTLSNSPIYFSLSSPDCDDIESERDTIKNSHDPNYAQVLCVNKPDDSRFSTIHYRVQCMNDGKTFQDDPSIELTFPFHVIEANITITDAKIKRRFIPFLYNRQSPTKIMDPSIPNRVKFEFSGRLANCPIPTECPECIAWVEFCIKVDSQHVNVLTGNIKPFDRNTNFGPDPYIIERYIPLDCDSILVNIDSLGGLSGNNPNNQTGNLLNKGDRQKSANDEIEQPNEELINYNWICLRDNTDCDCDPICGTFAIICQGTPNWPLIGGILIILLILLLLRKYKWNKPSKV